MLLSNYKEIDKKDEQIEDLERDLKDSQSEVKDRDREIEELSDMISQLESELEFWREIEEDQSPKTVRKYDLRHGLSERQIV